MAIGYDWLYGALSPDDRQVVRDAIFQKGLDPSIPIYERQISWTVNHYYWNPVCNGGLTVGALAVAEDDMQKCEAIVRFAVDSLPRALATYGPDGGWPEGETYWNYATRYVALDAGRSGNRRSVRTLAWVGSPGRVAVPPAASTWNVPDASVCTPLDPPAAYSTSAMPRKTMAARPKCSGSPSAPHSRPSHGWRPVTSTRPASYEPLDLVWYDRDQKPPLAPAWPLDAIFPTLGAATFRSNWEDPDALFLATAARDNKAPHAHLDLGSFIFEAGGVRWAIDLGPDDYGPGTRPHFSYYRTRTEAHNTLTIDGENQDPRAPKAASPGTSSLPIFPGCSSISRTPIRARSKPCSAASGWRSGRPY